MTLQKIVNGKWVEGTPYHGEKCRYVYKSGGMCETYYHDPASQPE